MIHPLIHRAIVFVHYDRDNIVDDYVYHYLQELSHNASYLVFVSTAKLTATAIQKLSDYCTKVIIRENVGYDFMSYKIGLESFDYSQYDEVVICNDSVYGPLYPIKNLFESMQNNTCDFWGITDNTDMGYHLQSYFFVIKKHVLSSTVFKDFWKNVIVLESKDAIIFNYEVGFTQILLKSGFRPAIASSFAPTKVQKILVVLKKFTPANILRKMTSILSGKTQIMRIGKINAMHYFWKDLVTKGEIPFIKIELLRDNPMHIDIADFEQKIKNISEYDITLINNHLRRMRGQK